MNYIKFWSNLISYMAITYDFINIETYNRNTTVINNIKEIRWDYKFISYDEIVSINGNLTEEIKNYVANNCITSKMKLIWFCIKLRNKDSENELILLPVYSRKERITITIHIVNENQLIFLKSLFGTDIYVRKI